MRCQHLSSIEDRKICNKMLEEGMDGEVSDFDVQHFCAGNPVYCYYHRIQQKQVKVQQRDALKKVIAHIFT